MTRPSFEEHFLNIAKTISERATCLRAKHGCVLVLDNTILSTGYNGSPPACGHCIDETCFMINGHCERCNHAEANAICQAAKKGISIEGATAYITGSPCLECLRMLICCKIKKVVYRSSGTHRKYPDLENSLRNVFIKESGIDIKEV